MEILMSYEIYIKKEPEYGTLSETLRSIIPDSYAFSEENYEENGAIHFNEESIDDVEQFVKDMNTPIPDWYGCNDFWTSIIYKNGILMVQHNYLKSEPKKLFCNKERFDKKYISLRDYLSQAEYIGKYFRRTEPISTGTYSDSSFMSKDYDTLALFKNDNIMIFLKQFAGEYRFSIINKNYLEDGKYEFFGEYTDKYNDKSELYQAIFKQLTYKSKKTL